MLSVVIFAREPSARANQLASLILLCAALWAGCEVVWNAQTDGAAALAIVKLSAAGWVWVGPLSLQLFLEIGRDPEPRVRRALPFLYIASLAFLLVGWQSSWIHSDVVRTSWGWAYELGPGYPAFYAFTVGCIVIGLRLGLNAYRSSPSPAERAQARWIAGGLLVPLTVASLTDGLLPFFGVQWPRLGTTAFAALGAMIAWSFYRHGFSLIAPGAFASEILQTLPEGIAMLNADGRIRSANPALARMAGRRQGDLVGVPISELLLGFRGDLFDEVREVECGLLAREGETASVSVSSTVLRDRQLQPIGLVVVARDVREVQSLRNRLVLSGRLAAVGELAAGIAHEINNPLAYVRTNLALLRRNWEALVSALEKAELGDFTRDLVAEGEDMIDESLQGVDRASAIVRDVRGLAHAGGGDRQMADLHLLLDGVARMAAPQLPSPACIEKRYGEIPRVPCAPQELQQVFLNLVLNAGHAIEPTGTIRIVTDADSEAVVVRVEDDGCGIAPDVAGRIFDPFFTTKAVGEGTGLGLPIAYEILRKHGGELNVESEPGVGTCFSVRLPVHVDTIRV